MRLKPALFNNCGNRAYSFNILVLLNEKKNIVHFRFILLNKVNVIVQCKMLKLLAIYKFTIEQRN